MSQSGGSGGTQVTAEAHGLALSLPGACPHCSAPHSAVFHGGPCPRVKAVEYHPNGTIKRVEYHDVVAPPEPPVGASGQHTPRGPCETSAAVE